MAKLKITGSSTGTGVITVVAPVTDSTRTITLPDATDTLAVNSDVTNKLPLAGGTVTGHLNVSSGGIKVGSDTLKNFSGYNFVQYGDRGMVGGYANDSLGVFYNTYHSSGSKAIETGTACNVQLLNGGIRFQTAASVSADAAQSLTDRLEITTDGRGLSQFTAKAWVQYDGTGTVAIKDSHNISSITDVSVGSYLVNFANNMANTLYCPLASSSQGTSASTNYNNHVCVQNISTNYQYQLLMRPQATSDTMVDIEAIYSVVFGD